MARTTYDIRTYLTLEKALTRRLVKDWLKRSGPLYAAIADACKAHNWQKARILATDVDLTEVGTENREWIKYLLLSCATFGAGMVSKDRSSFVGVGNFDTLLNQVTDNMLMYLEQRGTAQLYEEVLQLIAEDEAKSLVQKRDHAYGNTQIEMDPLSSAVSTINAARKQIADEDCGGEGKDVDTNHVTVRYGIEDGDLDALRAFIARQSPFEMQVIGLEAFPPSEHSEGMSPLVVRMASPDLHQIHDEIGKYGPFIDEHFPVYKPHCTLAYCKPEAVKKYLDLYVDGSCVVQAITISHKSGVKETIPFGVRRLHAVQKVAHPTCPHCGSSDYVLMPTDFETAKCKTCGKNWNHGIVDGINNPYETAKADPEGRYVTPFVSFDKVGEDKLQLIASLNASRLATWGFSAEADIRGIVRYKLTAILDGRTSVFCRFIHGHIFEVADARKKVNDVLAVQNPEDLRTVQPWPRQTKAAMDEFKQMSTEELKDRGLHIPPYHPRCRTILRTLGDALYGPEKLQLPPSSQMITLDTLKEVGITATQADVDTWNANVGLSPVEVLSKLSAKTPQELLESDYLSKQSIQFKENGDIALNAKGTTGDVKYDIGTTLDPFTGTYYLNDADLVTGTVGAETKFLKSMLAGMLEIGQHSTATSLAVEVGTSAYEFSKLGFIPDIAAWHAMRSEIKSAMEVGHLAEMYHSLDDQQKQTVQYLLLSNSEQSLATLMDLNITYQGKSIGAWIGEMVSGTFSIDLTDTLAMEQAYEYLDHVMWQA